MEAQEEFGMCHKNSMFGNNYIPFLIPKSTIIWARGKYNLEIILSKNLLSSLIFLPKHKVKLIPLNPYKQFQQCF